MRDPGDDIDDLEGEGREDGYLSYSCASCGEPNEVFIDPSAGSKQQFVEDCVICCRPNVIRIQIDETGAATIEAEFEG